MSFNSHGKNTHICKFYMGSPFFATWKQQAKVALLLNAVYSSKANNIYPLQWISVLCGKILLSYFVFVALMHWHTNIWVVWNLKVAPNIPFAFFLKRGCIHTIQLIYKCIYEYIYVNKWVRSTFAWVNMYFWTWMCSYKFMPKC